MLKQVEVLQLTRDAVSELIAQGYSGSTETDIGTLPLSDLVEFGTTLVNGQGATVSNEMWCKTLVGVMARFIVDNRRLKLAIPKMFKTSYEWGGFVEMVKFDLAKVYDSLIYSQAALTTSGNDFYGKSIADVEHDLYKTEYDSKIYEEFKDFLIPYTKPNDAIKSGLRGESDYMKFMAGLETAIERTLTQIINTYGHALASVAAAHSISPAGATAGVTGATKDGMNTAVHLLTEYNALYSTSKTAKDFFNDPALYMWCLNRILNIREYATDNTTAYNNHVKAVPGYDIHGIMLTEVYNRYATLVEQNAFNPVNIGEWDKVNCWQSSQDTTGKYFDFATNATIKITKDGAKGVYNYNNNTTPTAIVDFAAENVIALIYDDKAIGVTLEELKTTSTYTAVTDTVNIFMNKRVNYILNDDYPIVAFCLD